MDLQSQNLWTILNQLGREASIPNQNEILHAGYDVQQFGYNVVDSSTSSWYNVHSSLYVPGGRLGLALSRFCRGPRKTQTEQ
jgi:hypothetical protein